MEPAIRVAKLGKRYWLGSRAGREAIWALQDVSLEVAPGAVLGLIGRNGAGKSTLLKILARITEPTSGAAWMRGRAGSLLEVGTGFHPELSGRENVYLNGAILGMRRSEIRRNFDAIMAFAEVERFVDTPVKRYSSGMSVRLAFAVAAHLDTDILLVDEVLAVGDIAFQHKCLGKLRDVAAAGRTVLFVSHNMSAIASQCQEVALLDGGRLTFKGGVEQGIRQYLESVGASARPEALAAQIGGLPDDPVLRLVDLRIEQAGSDSELFLTSRPLAVTIELELREATHGLRIGFDLYEHASNHLVFRSFHDDAQPEPESLAPGRYLVRATVPANLLAATEYRLQLAIGIFGLRWIVHDEVHRVFKLTNLEGLNAHYADPRPGCVLPAIAWRSERITSAVSAVRAGR